MSYPKEWKHRRTEQPFGGRDHREAQTGPRSQASQALDCDDLAPKDWGVSMRPSTAIASSVDVESFIYDYFEAWGGIDEDRILSYYAENVTVQIPGTLVQGKSALREHFVRPFITAFPGNRYVVRNWIFGRNVVVVEWTFEAEHKGPFAGHAATGAHIEVPGCGVYEYDSANRQITAARIYFDAGTMLKLIVDH